MLLSLQEHDGAIPKLDDKELVGLLTIKTRDKDRRIRLLSTEYLYSQVGLPRASNALMSLHDDDRRAVMDTMAHMMVMGISQPHVNVLDKKLRIIAEKMGESDRLTVS